MRKPIAIAALLAIAACARKPYKAGYVGRLVQSNEIAAHNTLNNETIVVVGTVIHTGMLDGVSTTVAESRPVWRGLVTEVYEVTGEARPYAVVEGDAGPPIVCVFQPNKGREAADLRVGAVAKLKGRVTRARRDGVAMESCRVE